MRVWIVRSCCLPPRYRKKKVTCIVGVDARGFVLGPPIALALKVPFVMLRKKGKMPNSISGKEYSKEYVLVFLSNTVDLPYFTAMLLSPPVDELVPNDWTLLLPT